MSFWDIEADQWFRDNRDKIIAPERVNNDWALKLLSQYDIEPLNVLEIGCANGWRLNEIRSRYNSTCFGVDLSKEAVADGQTRYPGIGLKHASADNLGLDPCNPYDLVIVEYMLSWLSRERLLKAVAEIDSMLCNNGTLVLGDFLPFYPTHNSYKGRSDVFTFKLDYSQIFMSSGLYQLITRIIYNHDNEGRAQQNISSQERGSCSLLRKSLAEYSFFDKDWKPRLQKET